MQPTHPLELIQPDNLKRLTGNLQVLIKSRLWLQILIGLALGAVVGLTLGPTAGLVERETANAIGDWLAVPGKIFLTLIQMIVIPLVFSSVILGLAASENLAQLKRLGLRLAPYFVLTTAMAITIGIGVSLIVRPGEYIESGLVTAAMETELPKVDGALTETPSLGDLPEKLVEILPQNPFAAIVGKEMLQIVLFALIIGLALVTLAPEQSRPLLDLLSSVQEVCMKIVRWAMLLAPVAVFGLLAQITARVGLDVLVGMGIYVGTVFLGLFCMLCVYLVIVFVVSGITPWGVFKIPPDLKIL